ncbi:SDR family oxidoreductase [Gordonia sp. DT219]|uniref:SDR family oxidoreductase n=1 Tax=Gordonia sp. DT219 TaxID=3416658 RepID=UPI003CEE67AD
MTTQKHSTPTSSDSTPTSSVTGAIALVTGANRGLGRHIAARLVSRGAAKVYAAARNPESVDLPGVVPLRLDVTDDSQIAEAAAIASDVTLLVNNAGISRPGALLDTPLENVRAELDTNFWGVLAMVRAFAPVLAGTGGGTIVNVLSAQSWFAYPGTNGYHASKAAAWAITNGFRLELADQGTRVVAVHAGAFDTDFTADYDGPKEDPADIARATIDGLETDSVEILTDDWTRWVKSFLGQDPATFYAELGASGA